MSSINDMKHTISKYISMLPATSGLTPQDASIRASEFLVAMALLAEWKHLFTEEKIKYASIQTTVFSEEVFKGVGKTITENKLQAEASKTHIKAREDLERIENDISYLKTCLDLMTNAHLYYRQMAKGE